MVNNMKRNIIADISEKFFHLESKYNLLDLEIKEIKIWELIRSKVYNIILERKNIFNEPHDKLNIFNNIKTLKNVLLHSVSNNALSGDYKKNVLIFNHPRKKNIDGKFIDIYTNYFANTLDESEYEILELPYLGKHLGEENNNTIYLDQLWLKKLIKNKFSVIFLDKEESDTIKRLEKIITNNFKISINIKLLIKNEIKSFKCKYDFYKKLLDKRKPKKIFLVVSYARAPLVSAAKEKKIDVIEFQHGVIHPYHMGYNYPDVSDELEYFPDEIYSFGKYWKDTVDFPIDDDKIKLYGFPHLKRQRKKFKDVSKNENQILFISQGTIGKKLSKIAYATAKKLPNYDFIYKLHPGEYNRWKNKYKSLIKAESLNNFKVVDNNNKDLYHYFAESEYQVGVYSTAIYEGLAFDCNTILVDLPGVEMMKYLIEKDIVKFADDSTDIKGLIENYEETDYNISYFFDGLEPFKNL